MALLEEGKGLSVADIAAVMNSNGRNNCNDGFGGGVGAWWIIVLFLFMWNRGWGNQNGNNDGNGNNCCCNSGIASAIPYMLNNSTDNSISRGFDQQAIMSGITGINNNLVNGFNNAEVARCNMQANILQTLNNNQNATTAGFNQLGMSMQQCCCDQRAATADLKYTIAQEGCATRNQMSNDTRDLLWNANQNTQTLINTANANQQAIMDKLCQFELDNWRDKYNAAMTQNATLQAQLDRNAMTSAIIANNNAQTSDLKQYLNPAPIPAYVVANPNCCSNHQYYNGGCN